MPDSVARLMIQNSPPLPLLRGLAVLGLVMLGACMNLTRPPSLAEQQAESESCARSALCRVLIEDRPTVLVRALNPERLCELHAQTAEAYLKQEGLETQRYVVRLRPLDRHGFRSAAAKTQLTHTFVAAKVNNRWYAVDNGALPFCSRICRLDEALHGVDRDDG